MSEQTVFEKPKGAPDAEVHALMHDLSLLQNWCVLMGMKDSGGMTAASIAQRARILIVERTFK